MSQVTDRPTSSDCQADVPHREYRTVAGRFATGVAVVTTRAGCTPVGMTVNSLTTVSLDPLLLLVCLRRLSRVAIAVARSGVFAVTILAVDQRDCAQWFASARRPFGPAEFTGVPHRLDPDTGCLLLSDGVAYFGCSAYQRYPGGDHDVLLGEVRSWGLLRDVSPLLFMDGCYSDAATGEPR